MPIKGNGNGDGCGNGYGNGDGDGDGYGDGNGNGNGNGNPPLVSCYDQECLVDAVMGSINFQNALKV